MMAPDSRRVSPASAPRQRLVADSLLQ
jgi:hypothetical protein